MKSFIRCLLLFCSIMSIVGCAPGLGSALEITYLPPIKLESSDLTQLQKLEGLPIAVGIFRDQRPTKDSIEIDGRKVEAKGALPLLVQDAFRDALRLVKTEKCGTECITISGEISDWRMKISPDFPASTAKANVELKVEFRSSDGYRIAQMPQVLTGKTSGSSQKQHPLLDDEQMTEVYGEALNEAVIGALGQLAKQL